MTTTYRVLRRTPEGALKEVGVHECNGPNQAIKHFAEERHAPPQSSRFVAIPVRNWTEIEVAVEEQKPKIVMKEVDPVVGQVTIDEVFTDEHSVKV